ncbi:hypothetical protein [Streptomyces natalensis]|uniref:Uncharacterized protein n=1 Tax=Streptomyces natalensis ATCC 27448 TaxID=1240678 RepID=A0A0D7CV95_9ACTN|nr:hypothetical protein [Streptomyces natalensis]KIZ19297.1 hypothetical protein SNA_01860 [Streptomyces natalensis ATCC 27448]
MQRAPKVRLISLAGTAALAVVVPLAAATAGPAATAQRADGARTKPRTRPGATSQTTYRNMSEKPPGTAENGPRPKGGEAPGEDRFADLRDDLRDETSGDDPLADLGLPLLSDGARTSRCGPELASPQGIEAQTCILAEQGLTWARTYYRNPTGTPLRAVLTLLRPDGRSVQVHCEVPAKDDPGVCETPTGKAVHRDEGPTPYDAVAEISDEAGERLLLRSGGNSAPDEEGSDLGRKGRRAI